MKLLHLILFLATCGAALRAADERDGAEFFATRIEPILRERCYKCHSHSAEKIKGGLVLDSREAVLNGGDTAPAVVPGDPAKSLLIEAIGYATKDLQMPPAKGGGEKLADEQIAVLTEWVKMGAPWSESNGQKMTIRPRGKITGEDRQWWAFQPMATAEPPPVTDAGWSVNEIDRFVFEKLAAHALQPAPPAEPGHFLRRLYFDVTGLPPTPDEVDAFIHAYNSPAADRHSLVAITVDRLLASTHYGEQWARHWLDLVRYADSDGYKADDLRPNAWRYRDYVIRAFDEDKPYDRFVQEQLAGDELFPGDLDALVATGFLRHGIYEYNNPDAAGQWTSMLNDVTDVTGDVFLGLGVQCARCHDHKFDPILQRDYFRLQAFFAPLRLRDDVKLATPAQRADYDARLQSWQQKTADLRVQITAIEEPAKSKTAEESISKFPPEIQTILRKPAAERTPWEEQVGELAFRQILYEWERLVNHLRGPEKDKIVALQKQLAAFDKDKPEPLSEMQCVSDVGSLAPPVTIPKKPNLGEILPGFPSVLDEQPAVIPAALPSSTGRRAALARWLTEPENPLTARVIVNRVWQSHFGRGLVPTASDFGKLGEAPSHPELLDWLARRFIADGWSLKKLHRLILLSSTYGQSAQNPLAETARSKDPENRWLWRAGSRRLDAEQIRDAILAVTGELKPEASGPGVDSKEPRRAIYTRVMRNTHDPLLEVFDAPESFSSIAQRNVTTTPTQSLLMINSPWLLQRAQALAQRLARESSSDEARRVTDAYRLVLGRDPTGSERDGALAFIDRQSALVAPPRNEKKPAPFASEKMPFRDGRAALLAPGTAMDRLTIPDQPAFPSGDFTVEAFIVLKSIYEDGEVRTIASQWDGDRTHPGWSFGISGRQSRYKPQTLVLLLRGAAPWKEDDPVEPIFSGLSIEIGKPYFVAVSVKLGESGDTGVAFYSKDLSNDDEPLQVATFPHKTTSGIRGGVPLQIGARCADAKNLFDGLIDDVRLSNAALSSGQLLLNDAAVSEQTAGYWKFESNPGVFKDTSPRGAAIAPKMMEPPKIDPRTAAFADFCHVLLNASEFIYID